MEEKKTLRLQRNETDLKLAGDIIRNGGLVAFPTETVYGLGADALNVSAVKSVYEAKGRPSDNPMIVHISEMGELVHLIKDGFDGISNEALDVMSEFWPGPLTVVLPKSDLVPSVTTGGLDTIAVRMPANETAMALIRSAGVPIAAPSANLSGKPSPTTDEDVLEDMDGRIDAVLMGEICNVGIESTVIEFDEDKAVILRPGVITAEWIKERCGIEVEYDKSLLEKPESIAEPEDGVAETEEKPKSPGMKYRHYSPKAKVKIIEGDNAEFKEKAVEIGIEAIKNGQKPSILNYGDDSRKAAHKLFADLRELDRKGYDLIMIRALKEEGLGFSVMNRMLKSAGYDVI